MNTQQDLSKRLLRLFPVKILKEHFKLKSAGDELYDLILHGNPTANVNSFCFANLGSTKQHIYVYETDEPIRIDDRFIENFPYNVEVQGSLHGYTILTICPTITFRVIHLNPYSETTIEFKQPIEIAISKTHIIFYATILEKNINSYFPEDKPVILSEKMSDEMSVIGAICAYSGPVVTRVCDLNKGIKALWEKNLVDSKYAKWKKDRSTTTETMDENFTLKTQYPDIYHDMMKMPLKKMVFLYLGKDESLPDHFTIAPSSGQLSIPVFPKNPNQNRNVVREILSNNR